MNRQYPLESLLLSRSYDSNEKILELLASRYAINGKPLLILSPATNNSTRQKKKDKSLLKKLKIERKLAKNDHTRLEFKNYIQRVLKNQKFLKRKLSGYKDKAIGSVELEKSKQFKQIPHYDDFLNLNALWIGYIQDLLQVDKLSEKLNVTQQQQILNKLAAADFNGCFLQVLKSSDVQIQGKSGIVIWDSKNFFIIVQDSKFDTLKLIPKKNTIFNFVIPLFKIDQEEDGDNGGKERVEQSGSKEQQPHQEAKEEYLEFSIIGSRFQFKSTDRSGKKFKSRNVDDLKNL